MAEPEQAVEMPVENLAMWVAARLAATNWQQRGQVPLRAGQIIISVMEWNGPVLDSSPQAPCTT
jgi:hypothetical protein